MAKVFAATMIVVFSCLTLLGTAQQPRTYAIVVGISKYQYLQPLQYADRDAEAFCAWLQSQGIPRDQIKLFLNEDAKAMEISDEMFAVSKKVRPEDRIYFYFGGHGDTEVQTGNGNPLLLLSAAERTGYFKGSEYITLSSLRSWMTSLVKARASVFFVADACHSGGLIGGNLGRSSTQKALAEQWGDVVKVLSSQASEYSLEGRQWGGGRGLFSFHLVNGLYGLADRNADRKVTTAELRSYVAARVQQDAQPSIQRPIVTGPAEVTLARVDPKTLAELRRTEMLSVSYIGEVNIRSDGGGDLETKLDTSIVEEYKQMNKAIREQRISEVDDASDNAYRHYRVLMKKQIPPTLSRMITRTMTAALMERELLLMKPVRENGLGFLRIDSQVSKARMNLEIARTLYPSDHDIYKMLLARSRVLEAYEPMRVSNEQSIDSNLAIIKRNVPMQKQKLLESLALEPNMVSTYSLLSTVYRGNRQPDSANYYQEKVVELLPNEVFANLNAGFNYSRVRYKNAQGQIVPHPLFIKYMQKVQEIDSTLIQPLNLLAQTYMGVPDDSLFHNFPQAAFYYEKLLGRFPMSDSLAQQLASGKASPKALAYLQNRNLYLMRLHLIYLKLKDKIRADAYLDQFLKDVKAADAVVIYRQASIQLFMVMEWDESDLNRYFGHALELLKLAEPKSLQQWQQAEPARKMIQALHYRDLLIAIGATYRAMDRYADAEDYFRKAISQPETDPALATKLKMTGSTVMEFPPAKIISLPLVIVSTPQGGYDYRLCPFLEMFYLRMQQGDQENAFSWLERSFQVSQREHGNDVSGTPFMESIFATYTQFDQKRFLALRDKYAEKATK